MQVNLELIAQARIDDPMNTWPDHRRGHRCTIMGAPLFDYDCLRCHLEAAATKKVRTALERVEQRIHINIVGGAP